MAAEFDFIDWIRGQHRPTEFVPVPQGDDLAVLKWPSNDLLLIGVDQVLDGVHFDSANHSPQLIGRKAMNRNLSDCAAMACLPAAAVVAAALPRGTGIDYAKQLYQGLRDAGQAFDSLIVGGDTGSWDGKLALSVTILGRSAGIDPITRKGATAGDGIYVSGALGGSLLARHMTFQPRVALARELAAAGGVTAMIDVSDGLSRDLRHICRESRVGAVVEADDIPIHPDAVTMSRDGRSPLDHALNDGEDYELLITGQLDGASALVKRIGRIVAGSQLMLNRAGNLEPLEARSWEHQL